MKTCENKVVSAIKGIVIREKSLVGLDFTDPIACIIRISYTGSSYQSILITYHPHTCPCPEHAENPAIFINPRCLE